MSWSIYQKALDQFSLMAVSSEVSWQLMMEISDLTTEIHELKRNLQHLKESEVRQELEDLKKEIRSLKTCSEKESKKNTPNIATTVHNLTEKYGDGLTIHSLNYIYNGRILEKLFWFAVLGTAVAFLVYGIMDLTKRFCSYDVIQTLNVQHPSKLAFPSVRICDRERILRQFISYKGMAIYPSITRNVTSIIKLLKCKRLFPQLEICPVAVTTLLNGACIILNSNQSEYQVLPGLNGEMIYQFEFVGDRNHFDVGIELLSADSPHIVNPLVGVAFMVQAGFLYAFEVTETRTYNLLSPPYQNGGQRCLKVASPYLLIGKEEEISCLHSCHAYKQLHKCGAVSDIYEAFIPNHVKMKYKSNRTDFQIRYCLAQIYKEVLGTELCLECDQPCHRTTYKRSLLPTRNPINNTYLRHHFQLPQAAQRELMISIYHRDLQHEFIVESPQYPWFSFLAEIGGFLGLLTGCSAISIVEVVVFVLLAIAGKIIGHSERRGKSWALPQ